MTTESEVLDAARKLAAAQAAVTAADARHAAAADELKRASESQGNAHVAYGQAAREFNALIAGGIASGTPEAAKAPAGPPTPPQHAKQK